MESIPAVRGEHGPEVGGNNSPASEMLKKTKKRPLGQADSEEV